MTEMYIEYIYLLYILISNKSYKRALKNTSISNLQHQTDHITIFICCTRQANLSVVFKI